LRARAGVSVVILPAAWLALTAAAPPIPPVVLDWPREAQPYTRIVIKDAALTARIALGFDSALLLNLGPATAAKLKAVPLFGKAKVENAFIPGGSATARFNLYGVALGTTPKHTVPTAWIDKPIATDADGIVSLLSFEGDHVVLQRSGTGKTYELTRKGRNDAAVKVTIAGTEASLGLDLVSPETMLSSSAADALVRSGIVRRSGRVGLWSPFPGVHLPFERLIPVPGARLLGVPLLRPAARITEARAKQLDALAKAGTSTEVDDADAITVTATKKRKGMPWILVGRDVLDRCSRIELDRPVKVWRLTCDF
jgi:hypothetical protein